MSSGWRPGDLVLRGILSSAVDDRQLAVNPATNIKTPRRQHVARGYLSHRQVAALAAQLNRADAVLVNFLAETGGLARGPQQIRTRIGMISGLGQFLIAVRRHG